MKIAIVLAMLPLLFYPTLLGADIKEGIDRTLLWLYPAFVITGGVCAWKSRRDRPEISWILVFLMLACNACFWWLAKH